MERRLHRGGFGAVETNDRQPVVGPFRLGAGLRDRDIGLPGKAEQYARAAGDLDVGDLQRLLPAVARRDQHGEPRPVHRSHRRARQIGRARFLAHRHAVRDLEIMAVIGGGLVATEEDAGRRDVGRRREGLGLGIAAGRPFERHHVEELAGGRARIVAAHRIHRREDAADPLAFDRAGEDEVDANTARTEFERQFAREGVHRRLGHDVCGARVIRRAREDRRDVDDRSALAHRGRRRARHVPRDTEDVADGVADGFAVARTRFLQRGEFFRVDRQLLDRLLGACGASIVDEDIDPAEALDDIGDGIPHRIRIAAVERHGREARGVNAGLGADRLRRGVGAGGRAPGHHHGRALGEVVPHDIAADIPGRAGHNGDLARQPALAGRNDNGVSLRHVTLHVSCDIGSHLGVQSLGRACLILSRISATATGVGRSDAIKRRADSPPPQPRPPAARHGCAAPVRAARG